MNISNIKKNDVFSESSKYIFTGKVNANGSLVLLQYPSMKEVALTPDYIKEYLVSANQFMSTVNVTKLDKKDGTKGIRSIFEDIDNRVFTVCFKKQSKELSDKKYKQLKDNQISKLLERIEKAQQFKKGVLKEAEECLKELQENTIFPFEKGESRILKGFKVQFRSNDGLYDCVDLDFPDGLDKPNLRSVNINTIEWLIVDNTKYVVK